MHEMTERIDTVRDLIEVFNIAGELPRVEQHDHEMINHAVQNCFAPDFAYYNSKDAIVLRRKDYVFRMLKGGMEAGTTTKISRIDLQGDGLVHCDQWIHMNDGSKHYLQLAVDFDSKGRISRMQNVTHASDVCVLEIVEYHTRIQRIHVLEQYFALFGNDTEQSGCNVATGRGEKLSIDAQLGRLIAVDATYDTGMGSLLNKQGIIHGCQSLHSHGFVVKVDSITAQDGTSDVFLVARSMGLPGSPSASLKSFFRLNEEDKIARVHHQCMSDMQQFREIVHQTLLQANHHDDHVLAVQNFVDTFNRGSIKAGGSWSIVMDDLDQLLAKQRCTCNVGAGCHMDRDQLLRALKISMSLLITMEIDKLEQRYDIRVVVWGWINSPNAERQYVCSTFYFDDDGKISMIRNDSTGKDSQYIEFLRKFCAEEARESSLACKRSSCRSDEAQKSLTPVKSPVSWVSSFWTRFTGYAQ